MHASKQLTVKPFQKSLWSVMIWISLTVQFTNQHCMQWCWYCETSANEKYELCYHAHTCYYLHVLLAVPVCGPSVLTMMQPEGRSKSFILGCINSHPWDIQSLLNKDTQWRSTHQLHVWQHIFKVLGYLYCRFIYLFCKW